MFKVTPDRLSTHAQWLAGLADDIAAAGQKGAGVSFGVDSFGLVGQAFSGQARQTSQRAAEEIGKFADLTRDLGERVEATAADYRDTDVRNSEQLGQVEV
ncbi:type VII secretion target [Saccharopolyspora sp. 6V]|uniref:type VII secretion target n=1 Tax=Saccharopolyspora sp. 6V TaxID=2877239 RepID=UPI001CD390E1|nr:type VII secretion target [Saccharopolyspora sp. 6V]MCA1195192.1 ESX-1 secretion-associated protein [Saccharopolyspora sp. 6V]